MEEKDPATEALQNRYDALKKFAAENGKVLTVLQHLVDEFNEARKIVADRIHAMSKESRKPVQAGLLHTELKGGTAVDFDALEEIVEDAEFRKVVDIKYAFKGPKGKDGKEALLRLEGKYGDRLKGLKVETPPTVSVKGPAEADLGVLKELMG